jgi:hypothetical protein
MAAENMSVKDLKALLKDRGVDSSKALEKDDLVRLANESGGSAGAQQQGSQRSARSHSGES